MAAATIRADGTPTGAALERARSGARLPARGGALREKDTTSRKLTQSPPLMTKCVMCNGGGAQPGGAACSECAGAGTIPADNGRAILDLVKRHVKRSDLRE